MVLRPYRNCIRFQELLQHPQHLDTSLSQCMFLHEGQPVLVQQLLETKQLVYILQYEMQMHPELEIVRRLVYIFRHEVQLEAELALQAT
jgi:hypothetical protein